MINIAKIRFTNRRSLVFLGTLIILSSFLASRLALADAPSFTYVEAEYIAAGDFEVSRDQLSASVDLDGFALNASLELGLFFLQASRFELESDELFGANLEDNISTGAVGITFALPQTAIYGLLRVRKDELSVQGGGLNERENGTSVGLEAGVRFNLTDRLELNANIGSPAIDEGTSYGIGAQFFVTKHFGITLKFNSIEVEEDELTGKFDTSSIGVRFTF